MFQMAGFISDEFKFFFDSKWFLIENWKWIGLIVSIFVFISANKISRSVFTKLKHTIKTPDDNQFLKYFKELKIEKPLSWIVASVIGLICLHSLDLTPNMERNFSYIIRFILSINFIRLAYLGAEASGLLIQNWTLKKNSQINEQLAPLATKTLKVFVIIIGTLISLQNFGVDVTALLAGLGIGGVALAFAAQDTVANVFGTITILLDSPFKRGDRVKIMDIEGLVEEVGFRSTRVRTFANTVVIIPNSVVAKEKIDNFSDRENLVRFKQILGFTYNTPMEQIISFCDNVKFFLQKEPDISYDKIQVFVSEFAASSINVTVVFYIRMNESWDEATMTHKYLIDLYKIAGLQKTEFAFPTTTVILQK